MAAGNGADLGQVVAMLGTVLGEMRQVRETLADHSRELAELRFGLTDLRSTVVNYHGSVLGHGILISELEARIARVERHLELPPAA